MKRNNIFYLTITAFALSTLTACQAEDENAVSGGEDTLTFRSSVRDMNEETLTRTGEKNFFNVGDKISVDITTSRSSNGSPHTYTYNASGVFTGDFKFNLDNTYITKLVANWPGSDVQNDKKIILDQREDKAFQEADRLQATVDNINIMPTKEPIPLTFEHKQSRFSFRMAGQNANGLNIQSVILELQYDENYGINSSPKKTSGAFWAHCPGGETAELILVPGIIVAASDNGGSFIKVGNRFMIGQATVGNESTQYTGGIWLDDQVIVTLEAGKDYVVTLTPEGYNLIATITIGGFGQNEGFVGIPIQMPTPKAGATDTYEINNVIQLVTLSRLLKGGYIANQDATIWKSYNYIIMGTTVMTDNAKLYYLPIDRSLINQFKDESGNSITTIKHGTEDFNLFAN